MGRFLDHRSNSGSPMGQKSGPKKALTERVVKDIRQEILLNSNPVVPLRQGNFCESAEVINSQHAMAAEDACILG
jgi:hypothetical protein